MERRSRRAAGELKGGELIEAEVLVRNTFSEAWVERYDFPPDALARVTKLVKDSRWASRRSFVLRWGILSTIIGVLAVAAWPTFVQQVREYQRMHTGHENSIDGLRYIYIQPGEFEMGCSKGDKDCEGDEKPPHTVKITKGFWIGQTEVTQAAYEKVLRKGNPSDLKGKENPVENVSWADAKNYCEAVSLHLPTEAEWEYAARAGSKESRYAKLEEIA